MKFRLWNCLFRALIFGFIINLSLPALAVDDQYLWLEKIEDLKSLSWVKSENQISTKHFESHPLFSTFTKEALDRLTSSSRIASPSIKGDFVYNFWQDEKNPRGIWRRSPFKDYEKDQPKWEVLLDMDQLAQTEKKDWFFKGSDCFSPKYERCLIALSDGGKDAIFLREFDLTQRAWVKDGFEVKESKSRYSWLNENHLLIGTTLNPYDTTLAGYPRVLKIWKRGTPLSQAQPLFRGSRSDVSVSSYRLIHSMNSANLIQRYISFFESEKYVYADQKLTLVPIPNDAEIFGSYKGQVLFSLATTWTFQGDDGRTSVWPAGAVLSFAQIDLVHDGKIKSVQPVYIPQSGQALQSVSISNNSVYVHLLDQVSGRLLQYDWIYYQWVSYEVDLPTNGNVRVVSSNPNSHRVYVSYEDLITPPTLYRVSDGALIPEVIKKAKAGFDSKGLVVEQKWAKSKDGTLVPYFLVYQANAKINGKQPTLLYGYGGFGISMLPRYSSILGKLWLEKGGAYALANIRGGGEFGPGWHRAALKENRQRAFDDFIAVSEDLIQSGFTSADHLGIKGGSNGGLLVGVAMTQRPNLYKAVICQVPLLDMLRYHKLLAGHSWIGEYGDPSDSYMKWVLERYSPYHNLFNNITYPEALIMTSTRDDRVHPGHARKMVAKMKDMGHNVFYYENTNGGHAGAGDPVQRAKLNAYSYVYLYEKLFESSTN